MRKLRNRGAILLACAALLLLCTACDPYKQMEQSQIDALAEKTIAFVQTDDWQQSFRVTTEDREIGCDAAGQIGYIKQETKLQYFMDDMRYEDDVPTDSQTKTGEAFDAAYFKTEATAVFEMMQTYVQPKYILSKSGKDYKEGKKVVAIAFKTDSGAYELAATYSAEGEFISMNVYTTNTSGYKVKDIGLFGNEAEAIKEAFPSDLDSYERVSD